VNIREAINEIELGDGHILPKGATIVMPTYSIHRDPMHFPDPERFDPERFSPQNSLGRHPYAYIPFELGRRICAGYVFAIMEAKIILSTVLRRYCITEIEGGIKELEKKLKFSFVMSPANGIRVKFFVFSI
jgi:cytochrome P450